MGGRGRKRKERRQGRECQSLRGRLGLRRYRSLETQEQIFITFACEVGGAEQRGVPMSLPKHRLPVELSLFMELSLSMEHRLSVEHVLHAEHRLSVEHTNSVEHSLSVHPKACNFEAETFLELPGRILIRAEGLPVAPWLWLRRSSWEKC